MDGEIWRGCVSIESNRHIDIVVDRQTATTAQTPAKKSQHSLIAFKKAQRNGEPYFDMRTAVLNYPTIGQGRDYMAYLTIRNVHIPLHTYDKEGNVIGGAEHNVAYRKAQGHIQAGDGPRYKGKGFIQITWRKTYEDYFKYLKVTEPVPEAIKNKTIAQILSRDDNDMAQLLATDLYYATDSAGWFWKQGKKEWDSPH
jgi:predicted chitinase